MIIYFSGTGNSRAVATMLSRLLGEKASFITPAPDFTGEKRVIWVTPVYAWGLPPVMVDAISHATSGLEATHFLVATHGDDLGETASQWRGLISRKQWQARGAFSVIMPNTYITLPFFDVDPIPLRDSKLAAMPRRVEEIASAIERDATADDVVKGTFPLIKSRWIYPPFIKKACSSTPFTVSDRCISCGKCALICSMHNITISNRRPLWGDHCAGCLACYHVCPVHAINRGPFTRNKGQYICPLP